MFTGLVEDLGTVVAVDRDGAGAVLTVESRLGPQIGEGDSVAVNGVCLTATLDILKAIARGDGPQSAILALGYAGWGEGQLETTSERHPGFEYKPLHRQAGNHRGETGNPRRDRKAIPRTDRNVCPTVKPTARCCGLLVCKCSLCQVNFPSNEFVRQFYPQCLLK